MTGANEERAERVRRTRSARLGITAAATTGALGATLAIGTTIQTAAADEDGTTDRGDVSAPDTQGFGSSGQVPGAGRLAGPSGDGQAQGRTSGS